MTIQMAVMPMGGGENGFVRLLDRRMPADPTSDGVPDWMYDLSPDDPMCARVYSLNDRRGLGTLWPRGGKKGEVGVFPEDSILTAPAPQRDEHLGALHELLLKESLAGAPAAVDEEHCHPRRSVVVEALQGADDFSHRKGDNMLRALLLRQAEAHGVGPVLVTGPLSRSGFRPRGLAPWDAQQWTLDVMREQLRAWSPSQPIPMPYTYARAADLASVEAYEAFLGRVAFRVSQSRRISNTPRVWFCSSLFEHTEKPDAHSDYTKPLPLKVVRDIAETAVGAGAERVGWYCQCTWPSGHEAYEAMADAVERVCAVCGDWS